MKKVNAIKKLEKSGFTHTGHRNEYKKDNETIGFLQNSGDEDISAIYSFSGEDETDSMTDYFPNTWHNTISKAIKFQGGL